MYVFKKPQQVYRDTGITEIDRLTGSIYSVDPGVAIHHLISIWSYHTIKRLTLSFSTLGLTCSFRDFVDPQHWVVSYPPIRLLRSFSWILFLCHEKCAGELMVRSLPPISIVSAQRPPSCASLRSLNGHVQLLLRLCLSTICSQIDHMYLYGKTQIMHATLWCSKSCACNKEEYDKTNCLVVMKEPQLWEYSTTSPTELCSCLRGSRHIPQSLAVVSTSLQVSCRSELRSQKLPKLTILEVKSCSILNAPP